MGKVFNKGLSEDDKKEGFFKRLKNIEGKIEQMLNIKDKTENIKEVTNFVEEPWSSKATALIEEIRAIQKDVNYKKIKLTGGNNVTYDFSDYETFKELYRDLYYKNMTINDAGTKQNKFNSKRNVLASYSPKSEQTDR